MEITGRHYHIIDSVDCKIKIQDGCIGIYPIKINEDIKINQPLKENKWKFRQTNWTDTRTMRLAKIYPMEFKVIKYSHVIEYKTNNKTQKILINPTTHEIIEIKSQLKKYLIQKEYVIVGLIFVILSGIIAWLIDKFNY